MPRRRGSPVPVCLLVALLGPATRVQDAAKTATRDDNASPYRRTVSLAVGGTPPAIVVSEFFTHGALQPDGKNLAVRDADDTPVPWRFLQRGPGDFCRLAFQTVPRQSTYTIEYGGPPSAEPPPWTATAGLLLETRRWKDCDLNQLESIRQAWESAESIGCDYVPAVYHRLNPIDPAPSPFLSRYRGQIRIPVPGKYAFFTTSQDASFLRIDDKPVIASPGAHGPVGDARSRAEATLTAGAHAFEYVHAAAGPDACMVAAWQPPGASKPEPIPPAAFGNDQVAHLPAVGPFQGNRRLHDMAFAVVGEVPVADSDQPLVRVQFQHRAAQSSGVRVHWDFGDGQTSTQADPVHVYLHPGLYSVTATPGQSTGLRVVNRVGIGRAAVPDDPKRLTPDQLPAYLALIDDYDPLKLDPPSVVQLVRVEEQAGRLPRAASVARAWLASPRAAEDEAASNAILQLAVPIVRDRLDDPQAALALCQEALKALKNPAWRAEGAAIAADIAINELLQADAAVKALLDGAVVDLQAAGNPAATAGRVHRALGDYNARQADRPAALAAYAKAQQAVAATRPSAERYAWRGAYSRSTESFLRESKLDEALAELRRWQDAFPADRAEGELPYLFARYWLARDKPDRALALAADLVALNPESAHADRLLLLATDCEQKLGHADRARARLQALLADYPGSPLVPEARKRLDAMPASP